MGEQLGVMPVPMSESSPALGFLSSEMRPENSLEQQFQHIQEAMPEPRQLPGLRGVIMDMESSPAVGILLSEMRPENPLEQQIKHMQEAMSEMRPENPLEQQFQHIQEAMPQPRQSGLRGVIMDMGEYVARSAAQVPQIQKTLQRPQDITLARVQPASKAFDYFDNVLIAAIGGLIIMLKVCKPSEARELPVELTEPLFTAEETETSESEEEEPSAVPLTQLADFLGQDDEQEVPLSEVSFKFKPSVGTWYCEKFPK